MACSIAVPSRATAAVTMSASSCTPALAWRSAWALFTFLTFFFSSWRRPSFRFPIVSLGVGCWRPARIARVLGRKRKILNGEDDRARRCYCVFILSAQTNEPSIFVTIIITIIIRDPPS